MNPEETARAIIDGSKSAEDLMDDIRPLAASYLVSVEGLRNIVKWAKPDDAWSDAAHTLEEMGL
jgi:hypothetical protein